MTQPALFQEGARSGASLSPCRLYRYHLWRQHTEVEPLRRVLFVMLNPSTANGHEDDPTIRKCRGFADRWGFDRFDVANLFAFRSTEPRELRAAQARGVDIIGPDNQLWLAQLARRTSMVVVAWGAHAKPWAPYARKVAASLRAARGADGAVSCLGTTDGGAPRHPLMLAYETPLGVWNG